MASTEPKFRLTTSERLVLSTAVFILLSAVPVEPLQCYWCGPLAEQVHRSQRAPSCDVTLDQVTACEPGLTHCAVVATYPPYIESRYCVKLYQDECYSLFCNSTRSWRMTCPCRGDLCNGPNTAREIEAFAMLTKLVYKAQTRIRRTMITSHNFISSRRTKINNITEESNPAEISKMVHEEMQSDQPFNYILNDINNDNTTMEHDEKVPSTNSINHVLIDNHEDININNEDNQIDVQITTPDTVKEIKEEINALTEIKKTDLESKEIMDKVRTEIQILNSTLDTFKESKNEEKTEIFILNTTPSTAKAMRDEESPKIHVQNTTPEITEGMRAEEKKEIGIKEGKDKPVTHTVTTKSSENLPTAEALQHTASSAEKVTEGTTLKSTVTTLQATKSDVTIKPTMPGKNDSVQLQKLNVLTQIAIVLLQVYI